MGGLGTTGGAKSWHGEVPGKKKAVLLITNCNLIVKRFPHGHCHLAARLQSGFFMFAVAAFSKFAAKRARHTIPVVRNKLGQMTRQVPIF